jgi:hypothetical protein
MIGRKLVKTHFKTSIFNKYEDLEPTLGGDLARSQSDLENEIDEALAQLEKPDMAEVGLDPRSLTVTKSSMSPITISSHHRTSFNYSRSTINKMR